MVTIKHIYICASEITYWGYRLAFSLLCALLLSLVFPLSHLSFLSHLFFLSPIAGLSSLTCLSLPYHWSFLSQLSFLSPITGLSSLTCLSSPLSLVGLSSLTCLPSLVFPLSPVCHHWSFFYHLSAITGLSSLTYCDGLSCIPVFEYNSRFALNRVVGPVSLRSGTWLDGEQLADPCPSP